MWRYPVEADAPRIALRLTLLSLSSTRRRVIRVSEDYCEVGLRAPKREEIGSPKRQRYFMKTVGQNVRFGPVHDDTESQWCSHGKHHTPVISTNRGVSAPRHGEILPEIRNSCLNVRFGPMERQASGDSGRAVRFWLSVDRSRWPRNKFAARSPAGDCRGDKSDRPCPRNKFAARSPAGDCRGDKRDRPLRAALA